MKIHIDADQYYPVRDLIKDCLILLGCLSAFALSAAMIYILFLTYYE